LYTRQEALIALIFECEASQAESKQAGDEGEAGPSHEALEKAAHLAQAAALQEEKQEIQTELAIVKEKMREAEAKSNRDAETLKQQGLALRRFQEECEFEEACDEAEANPGLTLERKKARRQKSPEPSPSTSIFDDDFQQACDEAKQATEAIRSEYEAGARRDAAAMAGLQQEARELRDALEVERAGREVLVREVDSMREGYENMKEENALFCQGIKDKTSEVQPHSAPGPMIGCSTATLSPPGKLKSRPKVTCVCCVCCAWWVCCARWRSSRPRRSRKRDSTNKWSTTSSAK